MGNAWHNGLFTADFQVNTLVQVFFVIQCIWTGCMGTLVTIDPNFSPINEIGIFVRKPGTKKSEKGSRFLLSTLCAGWVRKKDESDEVAAIDPKEGTNLDDASNLDEASATDHKEGKNPVSFTCNRFISRQITQKRRLCTLTSAARGTSAAVQ